MTPFTEDTELRSYNTLYQYIVEGIVPMMTVFAIEYKKVQKRNNFTLPDWSRDALGPFAEALKVNESSFEVNCKTFFYI